jgi:hypothetical protein
VVFVTLGLTLASVVASLAFGSLLSLVLKKIALGLDRALAIRAKEASPRKSGNLSFYDSESLTPSVRFAALAYSLVGSLDATSPYTPAHKAKVPLIGPLC